MTYSRSRKHYFLGFGCALLLTLCAFGLVKFTVFETSTTLAIIAALALLQVIVHLVYFLHLNRREYVQTLIFALMVSILMTGGTFWVMSDLAVRMMTLD